MEASCQVMQESLMMLRTVCKLKFFLTTDLVIPKLISIGQMAGLIARTVFD
jgi:hypothetical protein